jgi:hypothetical protein
MPEDVRVTPRLSVNADIPTGRLETCTAADDDRSAFHSQRSLRLALRRSS